VQIIEHHLELSRGATKLARFSAPPSKGPRVPHHQSLDKPSHPDGRPAHHAGRLHPQISDFRSSSTTRACRRASTTTTGHGAKVGDGKDTELRQDKIRSATWLIRSIEQRQRTLRKVVESLVRFQKPFFLTGVEQLRPLVLKDVANDIGMHESTVSRATANKYVHTPQGIFELKYFFTSSIRGTDGVDVSSEKRQTAHPADDRLRGSQAAPQRPVDLRGSGQGEH
jgi:hypothetical protein